MNQITTYDPALDAFLKGQAVRCLLYTSRLKSQRPGNGHPLLLSA